MTRAITFLLLCIPAATGFAPATTSSQYIGQKTVLSFSSSSSFSRVSSFSLALPMAARRGKGGLDVGEEGGGGGIKNNNNSGLNNPKSIGGGSKNSKAGGDNTASSNSNNKNWVQTSIPSIASLPQDKNVVKLIDTNVPRLIDKATNPTGAVSIVNIGEKTYCSSSSCASCKIPLTKAEILDPNDETGGVDPRLRCDFCGAAYNLRTGMPLKVKDGGGWKPLGFLFWNVAGNNPLPVYALGERGGKVYINIP